MSHHANVAFMEEADSDSEIDEVVFGKRVYALPTDTDEDSDSEETSDPDEDKDGDKDELAIKESHEFLFRSKGKQNGAHYTISRDCTAGREAHCTALLAELATRNLRQFSLRCEDLKASQTQGISLRHNFGHIQDTLGIKADTRGSIVEWVPTPTPSPRLFLGRQKAEERKSIQPSTRISHPAPPILGFDVPEMADLKILSNFDHKNAQQSSSRGYNSHQYKDSNTARERTLLDGIQLRRSHYRQPDIDQMSPPLMKNRRQT